MCVCECVCGTDGGALARLMVRLLVAPSADMTLLSFLGASMFFKYVTPVLRTKEDVARQRQE